MLWRAVAMSSDDLLEKTDFYLSQHETTANSFLGGLSGTSFQCCDFCLR